MVGRLHRPMRLRPRSAAVVLCNPMGEEAARAHRLYRVLGGLLERAGYATLRFDYSGTGDSAGDADDATLEAWLDDIATAAKELGRAAPNARLVLVGLRLGASLASLACARHGLRAKHLVLWDPVIDGAAYLKELAAGHRTFMEEELSGGAYRSTVKIDANGAPDEALGTPLGPALVQGLRSLDLTRERPDAEHVTVVSTRSASEVLSFHESLRSSPGIHWVEHLDSMAWNSDAALNAATVPMDVLQTIVTTISEISP